MATIQLIPVHAPRREAQLGHSIANTAVSALDDWKVDDMA